LIQGGPGEAEAIAAVRVVQEVHANLEYNPNELLQLQALLVRLSKLPVAVA
jgi:hypothetical protein